MQNDATNRCRRLGSSSDISRGEFHATPTWTTTTRPLSAPDRPRRLCVLAHIITDCMRVFLFQYEAYYSDRCCCCGSCCSRSSSKQRRAVALSSPGCGDRPPARAPPCRAPCSQETSLVGVGTARHGTPRTATFSAALCRLHCADMPNFSAWPCPHFLQQRPVCVEYLFTMRMLVIVEKCTLNVGL